MRDDAARPLSLEDCSELIDLWNSMGRGCKKVIMIIEAPSGAVLALVDDYIPIYQNTPPTAHVEAIKIFMQRERLRDDKGEADDRTTS